MSRLSRLAWVMIGKPAARRQTIRVALVRLPSCSTKVDKIHVPPPDELPSAALVRHDVVRPLGPPRVTPTDVLRPISSPAVLHVDPLQGPAVGVVSAVDIPLAATQLELPAKLDTPNVHGKVLVLPDREHERAERIPLNVPPTVSPQAREPVPPDDPYLPEDLYVLLLPPATDLIGITFEWPSDLYPFQVEGAKFLTQRRHALLADDMGLGKTIQAIAAIRILMKAGWLRQVLVVCPASIKTNWAAEFRKWAPELRCVLVAGDRGDRRRCWRKPCHVLIANYMSLIRDAEYGYCSDRRYDLVILDEAQRIKNPGTKTAQTTKALVRGSSWALTGTPVENSADDIRSIFGFLHPDLRLGQVASWELPERIEPYFLRRRKAEVLDELPPKQMADRWLSLTPYQRAAYDTAETEGIAYLRDLGHAITITHVFGLITRLKQICNFDPRTEESCKLEYLRDAIGEIAAAGEKALVFSQFVETLRFLGAELADFAPLVYDGSMSAPQKDAAVAEFTESGDRAVMLVSLKAGGLGLNLQAASWVFHYDRWWTPAAERQAEDRAHRIGQSRTLMVERLMCEDSIEERIHQIQQRKQTIIDSIVERDYDDGLERLSTEEMFEAIGLKPVLVEVALRR